MSQNYEYFGKYILLEKLATGGMAEVWLARAPGAGGIGKFVAIKKILPQFNDNPEFIQMFKDEASIAMNLSHSNIVSIYEFGQVQSQLFLVMDYVEGRNLRQILNKMKQTNHKFSADQIIYVVKEVAAGLDHAHRSLSSTTGKPLNITHRDISPQNIMVTFEGEVKIVDFGIAKAESQIENTRTGTLKGKFGYMSPEQAEGHPTDLRTDIFSIGICLWELLASERLFIANNEINTLKKIRECDVPSLSKLNPNINSELERIVMKALTRDRNLRYQTAAALHRDMSRFLNRQYPDFSPHDFSVFIKTLYTDEILDLRKRLIEYAKIPFSPQTLKGDNEKAYGNVKQGTSTSFLGAQTTTEAKNKSEEQTVTETETFTESHQSQPSTELKTSETPATSITSPSLSMATGSDISENLVFAQKSLPDQSTNPKQIENETLNKSVLDKTLLKKSMREKIIVSPKSPYSLGDSTDADSMQGSLSLDKNNPNYGSDPRSRLKRVHELKKKSSNGNSSTINLMIFITFAVVTYVGASTYFPKETAIVETLVSKYLNQENMSSKIGSQKNFSDKNKLIEEPSKDTSVTDQAKIESQTKTPLPDLRATEPLIVNSLPSGAEIYLNGTSTGKSTPSRIDVPANNPFTVTLKLNRFLDYTKSNVTVQTTGRSLTATLQKAMVAYVDIDVKPPINVKVTVNGRSLADESLPITRYAVPAGTPITVRAENPIAGTSAEETVNLKEDQRYKIILQLGKWRAPSSTRK